MNKTQNNMRRNSLPKRSGGDRLRRYGYETKNSIISLEASSTTINLLKPAHSRKNSSKITVGFVEKSLTTAECKRYFVHWLNRRENIPIDIYEKLKITSITETYYPYAICSYDISGSFSAAAINKYENTIPWTGRYAVSNQGEVYCHHMFLSNIHFALDKRNFQRYKSLSLSPEEYDRLTIYEGVPINKGKSHKSKANAKAQKQCQIDIEQSISDTSICELKNIRMNHEKFVFNYTEIFLPICELKYKYAEEEYIWIMCLNGEFSNCYGTYPEANIICENKNFDYDKLREEIESSALKESNINQQLDVLDKKINQLLNEKESYKRKLSEQINAKQPWGMSSLDTMILYVPLLGLVGYIITAFGYVLGYIVFALTIGLILLCIVNSLRNRLIAKGRIEAQEFFLRKDEELTQQENKFKETKLRLLSQREMQLKEHLNQLEEPMKQETEPIQKEFARKLSTDCFLFIDSAASRDFVKFHQIPSWIKISQKTNVVKAKTPCMNISLDEVRKQRSIESEYALLCKRFN